MSYGYECKLKDAPKRLCLPEFVGKCPECMGQISYPYSLCPNPTFANHYHKLRHQWAFKCYSAREPTAKRCATCSMRAALDNTPLKVTHRVQEWG